MEHLLKSFWILRILIILMVLHFGLLIFTNILIYIYLLLFSHSVMSNSLWPHGLQHAGLPCPSPSPRVCPSSCLLNHVHCILESYISLDWGLGSSVPWGCSSGTGVRVFPGAESLPLLPGSHLSQSWLLHLLPSQKVPEEAFLQSSRLFSKKSI